MGRLAYRRRVLTAYLPPGRSRLTFRHENPEINGNAKPGELGEW